MPYSLRLIEDVLAPGTRHEAAARPIARVVYLLDGTVEALESDRARLASGAITAGGRGARLLRWELVRQPPPPAGGRGLLGPPLELGAKAARHLRCARGGLRARGRDACRQGGGWDRGHPPRTTLTRNPPLRLIRGHETCRGGFGNAQKIRVHGGCPRSHPPPCGHESRCASSANLESVGAARRAGLLRVSAVREGTPSPARGLRRPGVGSG